MTIVISEAELANRSSKIRNLLALISKTPTGPATKATSFPGTYIIGTYDGILPKSDYRDWRFRLTVRNMAAGYFEVWKDPRSEGKWQLEKAYLQIYVMVPETRDESEFICLHCDPGELITADHYQYKVGPHIHVKQASHPLPHSHIALNRCHLTEVLSSLPALTEAFSMGIKLIKEQVLDPLV
jgi:hypothetical protein